MDELTQAEFDAFAPDANERTVYATEKCMEAEGLRQMADVYERLATCGRSIGGNTTLIHATDAEQFRKMCRALGTFTKSADDNYFNARRDFDGGMAIQVFISRNVVCERVLIRTEEVPEQIVAAVPEKIIPAGTREVYEWKCKPSVLTNAPTVQPIAVDDGVPF